MNHCIAIAFSALAAVATATSATAQERSLNFSLGGGVAVGPAYPGAGTSEAEADVKFRFGALRWGGQSYGTKIGDIPETGVSLGGAFRVIGARDVDDNPELAGLGDIDSTVEIGLALTYNERNFRAFGEVRRGFGGHEGITGTIGADLIFRPSDRLTISAGPRINLGNDEFASTYFGVTGAQAAASNFGAFDAEGGMLGAGFEVQGTYRLNDLWAIEGDLSYEKLTDSAANSPITQAGSDDQWRISIGVSRAITLNF